MAKAERLDKILSNLGIGTRKELKTRIKNGEFAVDGITVKSPEFKLDPEVSVMTMYGQPIRYKKYVYLMLHKPAGYLTATEDRNAPTVLDLLDESWQSFDLFPAGRLDKDSEGLLLLTNDGPLTHKILSPKNHVDKLYYIEYTGAFEEGSADAFEAGLTIDGGYLCLPAKLQLLPGNAALVTIQEGKYHQVKRMAEACGATVTYLKRLKMGPLELDETLEKGTYRPLTDEEEAALVSCFSQE